jgi:hypothetical protein
VPLRNLDWQSLSYLVFDGKTLVAAFALRDDAEHWIEECGNRAMKLRRMSAPVQPRESKKRPAHKNNQQAGGPVPRQR